jgi:hypothetical protein
MTVSWLATGGSFSEPRTGRSETDVRPSTESEFVADGTPRGAIFIVLHDARGGVVWKTLSVSAP